MNRILLFSTFILLFLLFSCKKPAGEGGNSSIKGMINITNWNATFSVITGVYSGADIDVYIIYGNDITYGDRIKTGPDGVFEFKYLRKGSYKIYVYSKDKDAFLSGNSNPPDIAIYIGAEITKKKQQVDVGTIEIIK